MDTPRTAPKFRVAIIGAGIGGLSLAQTLRTNPKLSVTVYERQTVYIDRLAGYRIQMERQALDDLKASVPAASRHSIEGSIAPQPANGQQLGFMRASDKSVLMSWCPRDLREMVSVNRWVLREALLDGHEDFVQLGRKFVRYEEKGDEVVLYFEDGSGEVCDLLIGADGVWSKVRSQLLPDIKVKLSEIGVTYFKVPWTPENKKYIPFGTGVAAFCENNQVITIHSWTNPEAEYTRDWTPDHIGQQESFIMAGFGSELRHYHNKSKDPEHFSAEELRHEVQKRVRSYKRIDPLFVELADKVVLDSAYSNILKLVDQPEPWDNPRVTLLGDATMNMSPYTGKGASLAIADAMDLAAALRDPNFFSSTDPSTRCSLMRNYVTGMVKRRIKFRKGGVFIQNRVFSGKGWVGVKMREALFRTVDAAGHILDGVSLFCGSILAILHVMLVRLGLVAGKEKKDLTMGAKLGLAKKKGIAMSG